MKIYQRAAVYFVPHQDDWQLFMNPQVGRDIRDADCKTVIIHTTAGDAGNEQEYWRAREEGAIASLKMNRIVSGTSDDISGTRCFNGKEIYQVTVGSCTCYFLRLPDGAYDGAGFARYDFQSLKKLKDNEINRIDTVDGLDAYKDWTELTETIEAILHTELSAVEGGIMFNILDFDLELNPKDHCDHVYSSILLSNTRFYDLYPKRAFLTYCTYYKDEDLTGEDLVWKVGMFTAYHFTVLKSSGHSTIGESDEFFTWSTRNACFRMID